MIIAIQNTIGAIGRGLGIVTRNLQMWLGFTKADVVGAELVENGDFSLGDNGDWSFINEAAGSSISGDKGHIVTSSAITGFYQTVLEVGKSYILTFDIVANNGGSIKLGSTSTGLDIVDKITDVDSYEYKFISAGTILSFARWSGATNVSISNVVLKEITQSIPDESTNTNNAKLFTGKALSFNGNDAVSDFGNPNINLKSICFWVNLSTTSEQIFNLTSSQNIKAVNGTITLGGTWSNSNIYVNGLDTTAIGTTPTRVVITTDTNILVNDLEFAKIGSDYGALTLADVQIYDAELSLADALIDYNNPNDLVFNKGGSIALSNLKGYYALSEGSGSIAYDSSGEGNNGAITGATYDDKQPTIPQLGMMDWSKGSNLFVNSQVFTAWIRGNTSLTSNNTTSPLGDQTGSTLTTTNNGSTFYISSTVVASTSYTFSFYVKRGNMSGLKYRIYDNSNTNNIVAPTSYYSETSASAWVRVSKTFTTPSGCTSIRTYIISDSASTGTVRIWGSQLEESSTLGSYIGTSGSSASNATLIQNPNDLGKDVLGNALRLREGGFNLDGSGYAEVADDSSLDFGTGAFSMECWVRADYTSKGSSYNTILTLGGDPRGAGSAGLVSDDFQLYAYINGSFMRANSNYTNGDWYHIASTRDSGGACKLYIDSIAQTLTSTTTGDITNALVKTIGNDTINGREYENIIDDLRLYSQALSQKEIDNNYKIGLSKHS